MLRCKNENLLILTVNKYIPIIIDGNAIPASKAKATGAVINVPICQTIFFFLDQGFLPQNVHPDGLQKNILLIINYFKVCINFMYLK